MTHESANMSYSIYVLKGLTKYGAWSDIERALDLSKITLLADGYRKDFPPERPGAWVSFRVVKRTTTDEVIQ